MHNYSNSIQNELSLLEKKDNQIKRLQNELQLQRQKASNAVKAMENYKAIQNRYEDGGQNLRNEITKRIKVEQQLKRAHAKNRLLEEGIVMFIQKMRQKDKIKNEEEKLNKNSQLQDGFD